MNLIKVFLKNINVLNLLLLATAIFLFLKFNDSLIDRKINFTIFNPKEALTGTEEKTAVESAANYRDYAVITEKNLFHPSRKLAAEVKQKQQMARPEIILYGTLITDEKRIAYMEDKKSPYSTAGRGKRQIAVNEGGMIAGYKLAKVNTDSIVLVRGEDKITVTLNIQKERKSGESSGKTALQPQSRPNAYMPSRSTINPRKDIP
ncbi:MAG: hypothetical protein WC373_13355 [Smithella sp.]|jgi:antitoxin component YwqK of YwqJK toxin-antitoxin module